MNSDNEETIEVQFITQLDEKYKVTETPFRVPINLGRYGLSGVINHLLALDPIKPFDFLIKEEFLRTTLSEYVQEKKLSKENTLIIEYTEVLIQPEHISDFQHDDWVSCLNSFNGIYISGSYDCTIQLWNPKDNKRIATFKEHSGPVTQIALMKSGSNTSFVSSSKDQTIRVWNGDVASGYTSKYVCKGHTAAVESVAVCQTRESGNESEEGTLFCGGSWDNSISLWKIPEAGDDAGETEGVVKKRKTSTQVKTVELEPTTFLRAHTQCVSAVAWPSMNEIVSASWDHSIKVWDVEKSESVTSLRGDTVVYDMSYNVITKLIATGHNDRSVRIWDPRSSEGSLVSKMLHSHQGWVSSVSWSPKSEYFLVTGSYDNSIKIWDTRSSIPLHTLSSHHKDKVLCVGWDNNDLTQVLSGSADMKLSVFSMKPNKK